MCCVGYVVISVDTGFDETTDTTCVRLTWLPQQVAVVVGRAFDVDCSGLVLVRCVATAKFQLQSRGRRGGGGGGGGD